MIRSGQLANRGPGAVASRGSARKGATSPATATKVSPHVSPAELARQWSVSVDTVYRDIRKGALPAFRLPSGSLRVRLEDARVYGRPIE